MIQGQNGVSQNSNATKGFALRRDANIVNMQHDQKVSLRKRHVAVIWHQREFAHPPRQQGGASRMMQM
jgi:hypothetical protein